MYRLDNRCQMAKKRFKGNFRKNMSKTIPAVRKKDLVIQELNDEILIYDLQNNKVFGLNDTSALIWRLSNGDKTMSQIAHEASQKLNSPINEELVWLALGQLKEANLINNETEITNDYQGATRREVIRRIGLASMVALPMISALVAPSALQAQSSCGTAPNIALGCSCFVGGLSNSGNCASLCCNFVTASQPGICVPMGTVGVAGSCVRSCQCSTGCCAGGTSCQPFGTLTSGTPCSSPCQCTLNSCSGTCL